MADETERAAAVGAQPGALVHLLRRVDRPRCRHAPFLGTNSSQRDGLSPARPARCSLGQGRTRRTRRGLTTAGVLLLRLDPCWRLSSKTRTRTAVAGTGRPSASRPNEVKARSEGAGNWQHTKWWGRGGQPSVPLFPSPHPDRPGTGDRGIFRAAARPSEGWVSRAADLAVGQVDEGGADFVLHALRPCALRRPGPPGDHLFVRSNPLGALRCASFCMSF